MDKLYAVFEAEAYDDEADFFGMFEADHFDKEERVGDTWRGYMLNDDEELVLVAEYTYSNDDGFDSSGHGWYDESKLG